MSTVVGQAQAYERRATWERSPKRETRVYERSACVCEEMGWQPVANGGMSTVKGEAQADGLQVTWERSPKRETRVYERFTCVCEEMVGQLVANGIMMTMKGGRDRQLELSECPRKGQEFAETGKVVERRALPTSILESIDQRVLIEGVFFWILLEECPLEGMV